MIFLTNEHIRQVLDMPACLEAMEDAYKELNAERAGYRPRIDFIVLNNKGDGDNEPAAGASRSDR